MAGRLKPLKPCFFRDRRIKLITHPVKKLQYYTLKCDRSVFRIAYCIQYHILRTDMKKKNAFQYIYVRISKHKRLWAKQLVANHLEICTSPNEIWKEASSEIWWNTKKNKFLILLFCAMTKKCTIISQIITFLHVSTLSCHPQGACNQYLAKLHKYFKHTFVNTIYS